MASSSPKVPNLRRSVKSQVFYGRPKAGSKIIRPQHRGIEITVAAVRLSRLGKPPSRTPRCDVVATSLFGRFREHYGDRLPLAILPLHAREDLPAPGFLRFPHIKHVSLITAGAICDKSRQAAQLAIRPQRLARETPHDRSEMVGRGKTADQAFLDGVVRRLRSAEARAACQA